MENTTLSYKEYLTTSVKAEITQVIVSSQLAVHKVYHDSTPWKLIRNSIKDFILRKINWKCMCTWCGNALQPHPTLKTMECEYAICRGAASSLDDFVLLEDGESPQEASKV